MSVLRALDKEAVLQSLLRAVTAAPTDLDLRSHYVSALFDAGRLEEALADCAVVLEHDPSNTRFNLLEAKCARKAGEFARAAAAYERMAAALRAGGGGLPPPAPIARADAPRGPEPAPHPPNQPADDDLVLGGELDLEPSDDLELRLPSEPPEAPAQPEEAYIDLPVALAPSEPAVVQFGPHLVPLQVLFGVARTRSSGALRFQTQDGSYKVHYSEGCILEVFTTVPSIRLGPVLAQRGWADLDRLSEIEASTEGRPSAMLDAILEGTHNPALVRDYVSWGTAVLSSLLTAASGHCQFVQGLVHEPRIGLFDAPYEGECLALRGATEAITATLGQQLHAVVSPSPAAEAGLADLPLDASEQPFVERLAAPTTVGSLVQSGDASAGLRLVYLGLALQALTINAGATQAPSIPAEPASPPTPPSVPSPARPSMPPGMSSIPPNARGDASALSANDQLRRDAALLMSVPLPPQVDPSADRTSDDPDELVRLAMETAQKGRYADGIAMLKRATVLRPAAKAEHRAHEFYLRAMGSQDDRQAAVEAALFVIPRLWRDTALPAYAELLMGRLFKLAMRREESRQAFERALQIDPTNSEARTEVNMARRRAGEPELPPGPSSPGSRPSMFNLSKKR